MFISVISVITSLENITTITVRRETRDRIAALGAKEESFDSIPCRLLETAA